MSLRENVAQIGGFKFIIDEDKIAKVTNHPRIGERCFKGGKVDKKWCRSLLLPLPANAKLKIGVSVKFLKPKCWAYYEILVKYVSCDGRLSHLHYYHLRLLLVLKGCKLNLPFYLLQSLKKMAHSVQSTIGNPDRSLFHHSLIKILIQHQLSLSYRSWDEFLVENKLGSIQY